MLELNSSNNLDKKFISQHAAYKTSGKASALAFPPKKRVTWFFSVSSVPISFSTTVELGATSPISLNFHAGLDLCEAVGVKILLNSNA